MDGAKDIDVHLVLAHAAPAKDHVVEAALVLLGDPVGVVHLAGAVDADSDEVLVLLEKHGPLVVNQCAVRLDGVLHALVGLAILLRELHRAAKEVEAPERGLSPPCHDTWTSGAGDESNSCLMYASSVASSIIGLSRL